MIAVYLYQVRKNNTTTRQPVSRLEETMNEIRKNDYAIQQIGNMIFYGYYYQGSFGREQFHVIEAKEYTARKLSNMKKKYGF